MSRPPEFPRLAPVIPFVGAKPKAASTKPAPLYAELQCLTNFTFLEGASHAAELVAAAKSLGHAAIGIADRNSLAGVVRAHAAAKKQGLRLLVGARLDVMEGDEAIPSYLSGLDLPPPLTPPLKGEGDIGIQPQPLRILSDVKIGKEDTSPKFWSSNPVPGTNVRKQSVMSKSPSPLRGGVRGGGKDPIKNGGKPQAQTPGVNSKKQDKPFFSLIAYPKHRAAYGALSRLISLGRRAAPKGECHFTFEDMLPALEGQMIIVLPPDDLSDPLFAPRLRTLCTLFPANVFLGVHMLQRGTDRTRALALKALALEVGAEIIAVNDVIMHDPARRPLADVITCIREKTKVTEAGFLLQKNAERYLKTPDEMARLLAGFPDAIANIPRFLEACTFSLDELSYNYPDEPVPEGVTQPQHLRELALAGAENRYPEGVPAKVKATLEKELSLIAELKYEGYFLTVNDIVRFARSKGILCQGRGSAANSAVCYCLGVTAVDPSTTSLLFERFISTARKEPPDIDVDFEHERREEVIQYIYQRYGRERAALAATVITYRPRSAVREVGKVMGLTEDVTAALSSSVWGSWGKEIDSKEVNQAGLDLNDPHLKRVIELTQELLGFPRHLSQHVGGFVLTRERLDDIVPIGNAAMDDRTFIEWDKDDLDELKILKVDVLALGMLTCIAKSYKMISAHYGKSYDLATMPKEDPAVYDMLCKADAIGVFQVESRAQMNMLPRMKPRRFYDLVIEVAIVRPGPIQGDMVHPYLRRRDGIEHVEYPSPAPEHGDADELKKVLGRTLGVPLFQEQAMQIAIDAAKFTPDEANDLRRAMATFRRVGTIHSLQEKMVGRMISRGYDPDFAKRCFDQIKGFGEYGFPESHAASFALLVYASAWIKCHYPGVFCACLLNSQPMGFYAPAQIVRDAREHAIIVRPVDVSYSNWDCTLEDVDDGIHAVRLGFRQLDGLREEVMREFVAVRENLPVFETLEDVRKAGLSVAVLERLAAGDGLRSLISSSSGLSLPPPLTPPLKEEGDSSIAFSFLNSVLDTEIEEQSSMSKSPSPLRGGIEGGGEPQLLFLKSDCCDTASQISQDMAFPLPSLGGEVSPQVTERGDSTPVPPLRPLGVHPSDQVRGQALSPQRGERKGSGNKATQPAKVDNPRPLDRRNALWDVRGLMSDKPLPLFDAFGADPAGFDVPANLPDMPLSEHVVADYQTSRLSLKAHPVSFLRGLYTSQRIIPAKALFTCRHGDKVTVAGVVLVRQRPGTAKGVVFMTLEDETGVANIVVWKKLMEHYRKEVMQARLVAVEGIVQRAGDVIHVVARAVIDRTSDLSRLAENGVADFAVPLARADEVARPVDEDGRVKRMRARAGALSNNQPLPVPNSMAQPASLSPARGSHPRNVRVIPKSRDFH